MGVFIIIQLGHVDGAHQVITMVVVVRQRMKWNRMRNDDNGVRDESIHRINRSRRSHIPSPSPSLLFSTLWIIINVNIVYIYIYIYKAKTPAWIDYSHSHERAKIASVIASCPFLHEHHTPSLASFPNLLFPTKFVDRRKSEWNEKPPFSYDQFSALKSFLRFNIMRSPSCKIPSPFPPFFFHHLFVMLPLPFFKLFHE